MAILYLKLSTHSLGKDDSKIVLLNEVVHAGQYVTLTCQLEQPHWFLRKQKIYPDKRRENLVHSSTIVTLCRKQNLTGPAKLISNSYSYHCFGHGRNDVTYVASASMQVYGKLKFKDSYWLYVWTGLTWLQVVLATHHYNTLHFMSSKF